MRDTKRKANSLGWLIGVIAVVLLGTVATLEYVLPTFKVLKLATEVGGLLAVIAFFAQLLGNTINKAQLAQQALEQRLKEEIKALDASHTEKLRDLQEAVAKLEQRLEIHIFSYGHKDLSKDFHHLNQTVVAVRTELALMRGMDDAFDRLDVLEKKLNLGSQG